MVLDTPYASSSGWHFSFSKYKETQFRHDKKANTSSQEFEADILIQNRGNNPLVLKNVACIRVSKL